MKSKGTLGYLILLTTVSFGLPVLVFGLDAAGFSSDWFESLLGWAIGVAFGGMVILTLWAMVEAIKIEEKTGEPGVWLGFFFLTGPIGGAIYLWNLHRKKLRQANPS